MEENSYLTLPSAMPQLSEDWSDRNCPNFTTPALCGTDLIRALRVENSLYSSRSSFDLWTHIEATGSAMTNLKKD